MSSKTEDLKRSRVQALLDMPNTRFARFKGSMLMSAPGTSGFIPLEASSFAEICYSPDMFGFGISESNIRDLQHAVSRVSPDLTNYSHFVAFKDQIWDMETLDFAPDQMDYVYSTNISLQDSATTGYAQAQRFLLELAKGDADLAFDYQQAIAPLFMATRPAGVIWFVGDGANGKSSLIKALYMLFGPYFASITTAQIEDGKVTLALNGKMGNIVKESSEARVEDTERYKAIGTHESFAVRQLYTQSNVMVDTDFHTIFNANNIPVFADKTKGARRRTLIVPFPAHFEDNPTFEKDTFTPEFLGGLAMLALEATAHLKAHNYRYTWSDATILAKRTYDNDVNSVEAFLGYLHDAHIYGFTDYRWLEMDYQNWCSLNGMVPLGRTQLNRTMTNEGGAVRRSIRVEGRDMPVKRYFLSTAPQGDNLTWLEGYGTATPTASQVQERLELDEQERGNNNGW